MEAGDAEAVHARLKSLGSRPVKVKKKPIEIIAQDPGIGGVTAKDLVDLHPPVRDDDRRRPAARAVPRHPRRPDATTPPSARCSSRSRRKVEPGSTLRRRARRITPRSSTSSSSNLVAAGEVGGILDTILQPARDLHRRRREAEAQGQGRDGLPDHRHRRRHRRHRACCSLKVIPVFEKMFKDFGGGAAGAHPVRHRHLERGCSSYIVYIVGGDHRRGRRASRACYRNPKGRQIFDKSLLQGADLRAGACARWPSRASPARWARCSARACPSSTRSRSSRRPPATHVVETGHLLRPRARSPRARTSPARCSETKVFPPMVVQMIGVGEATGAMDADAQQDRRLLRRRGRHRGRRAHQR